MITLLPILLKAKTWFLARKVQIAFGLILLVALLSLTVGAYQLGKTRAEHSCALQKVQTELQEARDNSELLLDLQKETREFYREQQTFNQSFMQELNNETVEVVHTVKTIYEEVPIVQVTDPDGRCGIDYSIVRLRNDAGRATANPN